MYVKYIILNSCLHIFYSYRFSFALVNVQTAQYTMAYLGAGGGGGARGGGGSGHEITRIIFRFHESRKTKFHFHDF